MVQQSIKWMVLGAWCGLGIAGVVTPAEAAAQAAERATSTAAPARANGVELPADYVIGPEDVLEVTFWREKDLSGPVVVRPDGQITLPLINDVTAAGLTPDQLRERIEAEARRFVQDPLPTVVVKQINSRKVYITGEVDKPGTYPLSGPMTVVQLLAMAGGLTEFADAKNIAIVRAERGRQIAYRFNYRDISKRKKLVQNIQLKPGDTVVVP